MLYPLQETEITGYKTVNFLTLVELSGQPTISISIQKHDSVA